MKPIVGQIVHYYVTDQKTQSNGAKNGPYAAVVTQVFDDSGMVNLLVLPPFGTSYHQGSVMPREQAFKYVTGDNFPYSWWEWPPQQE